MPCDRLVLDMSNAPALLATVDALARLQLEACRAGHCLRLRGASPELLELIELAGLAEVLPVEPER
jgi:hypothetical protein